MWPVLVSKIAFNTELNSVRLSASKASGILFFVDCVSCPPRSASVTFAEDPNDVSGGSTGLLQRSFVEPWMWLRYLIAGMGYILVAFGGSFLGLLKCCEVCFLALLKPLSTLWCWRNGFIRPVLKHGPRSLTHVRVHGWWNLCAQWKWLLRCLHQQPTDRLGEVWAWAYLLGPERWWTMPVKGEVWGNSDGGS